MDFTVVIMQLFCSGYTGTGVYGLRGLRVALAWPLKRQGGKLYPCFL